MALGVHADQLFARELDPHRTPAQAREQRRLSLDCHILLAAECAAVRDQLDKQPLLRLAKHRGDLAAVLEDALALGQDVQPTVGQRPGQAGLWFEEQVLDPLGLPFAADDMRRRGERGLDVAARVARCREHVAVLRIDLRRAGPDRLGRVEHRGQGLVVDLDPRGRFAGEARRFGRNRGQHVADIPRLFAFGDEHGPVGKNLPDPAVAGNVGGGRDRCDPRQRKRLRDVDAQHPRAGVRRQNDCAIEEAGRVDVGDERARSQRKLRALIALQRIAHPAVLDDRGQRGAGELGVLDELDRVEDLDVAGAAAKVPVEELRHLHARKPLALVGDPFDAQHQPGRAEPALQPGRRLEGVGVEFSLVVADALERRDRPALDLLGADRAGELRLAVEQHQAGAAFPLRRATGLDRLDLEGLAKGFDEKLVGRRLEPAGFAVQRELNGLGWVRHGRSGARSCPTRYAWTQRRARCFIVAAVSVANGQLRMARASLAIRQSLLAARLLRPRCDKTFE